jgi:hypothetical protein
MLGLESTRVLNEANDTLAASDRVAAHQRRCGANAVTNAHTPATR